MMDKHCGNCKYCGEVLKDNLHSYNNDKSIFKACLETATGCEKFEPTDLSTIEDNICKELKLLRKSKRITQEEMGVYLAKQLGKDKPINNFQIYNYECRKNRITFPIFVGWCKVCDADPREVFNRAVKE